jgi:hypothetical protein
VKKFNYKRPTIVRFYLYEIFRSGKFVEIKCRLIVAQGQRDNKRLRVICKQKGDKM